MNLGPTQTGISVAEVARREGVDISGGVSVSVQPFASSNDNQRCGFHWILHEWLKLDPAITDKLGEAVRGKNPYERLKSAVLIGKFGGVELTDRHGNRIVKPLVRTTQRWDEDLMDYRRKKISKSNYSALVEYRARKYEGGMTVLPEMDPRFKEAA